MGEQRFARHAAVDEMTGSRRLGNSFLALRAAIFGTAGDDDAEFRRRHVEPSETEVLPDFGPPGWRIFRA